MPIRKIDGEFQFVCVNTHEEVLTMTRPGKIGLLCIYLSKTNATSAVK